MLILGPVGRKLAAGMTGGVAYVWDPQGIAPRHLAETAPSAVRPPASDHLRIRELIEQHHGATGSESASAILDDWQRHAGEFWVLRPRLPARQPATADLERKLDPA